MFRLWGVGAQFIEISSILGSLQLRWWDSVRQLNSAAPAHELKTSWLIWAGTFTATYIFTAANEDYLLMEFIGLDSQFDLPTQQVAFDGIFEIVGGSRRFDGATGGGDFSGWAVFTEPLDFRPGASNMGPGFVHLEGVIQRSLGN